MSVLAYPVQAQNFSLSGAGSSIGDVVLNLKSFKDILGVNLTMTQFGSIGYGTIEAGNGVQEEQISFSGVTQNSDGTAQLTGVKHVLFIPPYTETNGMTITHPGSVIFIISNTAAWENSIYTYANTIASGGAPASSTVTGITKLTQDPAVAGTPIAVGSNTSYSGTAISTSNKAVDVASLSTTAASGKVVRALDATGLIDSSFLNIKPADIQTFTNTGANTWTMPTGAKSILIQMIGGGGNGTAGDGAGGGGGEITEKTLSASLITSPVTVTVGGANQDTSFGSYIIAKSGAGGNGGTFGTGVGTDGTGSSVNGGPGTFGGGGGGVSTSDHGGAGSNGSNHYAAGGGGGGYSGGGSGGSQAHGTPGSNFPIGGAGGNGGSHSSYPTAGSNYGGGGGGGGDGTYNAGGAGAQGIAVITTYF